MTWWDDEPSPVPRPVSPENAQWVRETLARIALGGREEEVAAWREAAAEREAIRLEALAKEEQRRGRAA